ncbi:MAG TPA: hypothetical protein VLD62_03740 [Acidimicrobiia bacterium]|nr:hypothetical protein [Acidimicrobiia bacterium]
MRPRALRGLATLGVATGIPLTLASGAVVAATSPGGSPAVAVLVFGVAMTVFIASAATFLALAMLETRQTDNARQGLGFAGGTGDAPADDEGDPMTNQERR